ncbi:hypothetical protein C0Q70_19442 [Pomacea canaliculata]|uniref:phosphoethanolamine N-methyltransferase n=1 Tax=Pomacea canaliculata TaxID=400727 RepID=A0A2T7NJC8_POMCA|nr:hypothetical protein C0Q70_19442 [Pomacea canaliculata]
MTTQVEPLAKAQECLAYTVCMSRVEEVTRRFTSEFAAKAERVVAVDFMQDFMDKNEKTNKDFGNIDFICNDVTQLTQEVESADLIFSNWLLMYLEDQEIQKLLVKLLSWLKPGGHFFLRESCRDPSGDKQRSQNPTQYRDHTIYEAFMASTIQHEGDTEFVSMLKLQPGQKILDVGGGIGGGAFYMAKEFGVKATILDLSSNMTQIGLERAQELGIGPDEVCFEIADATKREYPRELFDVVYSRDTILHIEDKLSLFKKFFKWIKPGGKVLISDYCCSDGPHSKEFKAYVEQRGYNLLSPVQYGKLLEEAGFIHVLAEDRSEQFTQILHKELEKTESIREEFIKEFSEEDYNYIINGWKDKVQRAGQGDQRWGLFMAEKPEAV